MLSLLFLSSISMPINFLFPSGVAFVNLGQRGSCVDHRLREQPGNRAGNARKLLITFGIVFVTVQLVQKKPCGCLVARASQQIGVGGFKTLRLKALDRRTGGPTSTAWT